jgi:hypothetical protein
MEVSGHPHVPCIFTPGDTAYGTHCVVGWVGPIADPDIEEKKSRLLLPEIEARLLGCPNHSLVAVPVCVM